MATASPSSKELRRNIALSAVNHFFVEGGMTLADPNLILPLFVRALGGSTFLAGLIPSLRWFGWMAPQFLAAGSVERLSRLLPLTRVLELARSGAYLLIALLAWGLADNQPGVVLGVFFALFMLTRFAAGSSAVARAELIARIVPARQRPLVISLRRLGGGIAGFLAGIAVQRIVALCAGSVQGYSLLVGAAGLSMGLGILVLSCVSEPVVKVTVVRRSLYQELRRVSGILRHDRAYLWYILMMAAGTGLTVATPFYIVYATEELGMSASIAGVYIAIRTSTRVASNVYWGRQCQKRGSIWLMQAGMLMGLAAPCWVLLTGLLRAPVLGHADWLVGVLFALVFVAEGLAAAANGIGRIAYIYEISPVDQRPTYYGLANTILGPLYFLPALGGALLGQIGFGMLFAVSAGMMLVAFVLALQLGRRGQSGQQTT